MSSPIILDASAALDFAFGEGDAPSVNQTIVKVAEVGAVVPQHWRLEVANGMAARVRRKVLTGEQARQLMSRLERLNVALDETTAKRAWTNTFDLAEKHSLTTYDAAYLELALRRGAELATFDIRLAGAAQAEGVRLVLPPR